MDLGADDVIQSWDKASTVYSADSDDERIQKGKGLLLVFILVWFIDVFKIYAIGILKQEEQSVIFIVQLNQEQEFLTKREMSMKYLLILSQARNIKSEYV